MNGSFQPIIFKQASYLILIVAAIWFSIAINTFEEDLELELTAVETEAKAMETVDLQLFVRFENANGYEDATVTATYEQGGKVVEVLFHHVEDGLYEGEARFDVPGIWRGKAQAKTFTNTMTTELEVEVQ